MRCTCDHCTTHPDKTWIGTMRQIRKTRQQTRPRPQDIDTRTPSGNPLPY